MIYNGLNCDESIMVGVTSAKSAKTPQKTSKTFEKMFEGQTSCWLIKCSDEQK